MTVEQAVEVHELAGVKVTHAPHLDKTFPWVLDSGDGFPTTFTETQMKERALRILTEVEEVMRKVDARIARNGIKPDSKIIEVDGEPYLECRSSMERIELAFSLGMTPKQMMGGG